MKIDNKLRRHLANANKLALPEGAGSTCVALQLVLPFRCGCCWLSSHGQYADVLIAAITATKIMLLPCIIGNLKLSKHTDI